LLVLAFGSFAAVASNFILLTPLHKIQRLRHIDLSLTDSGINRFFRERTLGKKNV
jgi:hypothetical protein